MSYHVTYKDSKRIISCDSSKLESSIAKLFAISLFKLQIYNQQFEDWVDVENDLPSSGKILVQECDLQRESSLSDTSVCETSIESSSSAANLSVSSTEDWFINFKLPDFPKFVVEVLATATSTTNIPKNIRNKIVQVLCDTISTHDMYPAPIQIRHILLDLVRKYPVLKDKHSKSPIGTWVGSSRQRLKDMRRPLHSNAQVQKMKIKYGVRKSDEEELFSPRPKTQKLGEDILEDEESIKYHILVMKGELKKTTPNTDLIKDRMQRTFNIRRKMVLQNHPISEIIKEFPALNSTVMLILEAETILTINISKKMNELKTSEKFEHLQKFVKPKSFHQLIDKDSLTKTLVLLPTIVKESSDNFVIFADNDLPDVQTPYPIGVCSKNVFSLYVDGQPLCCTEDIVEGVEALLSSYWCFNITFPKPITKTLQLLRCLLGISIERVNTSVQRILNGL